MKLKHRNRSSGGCVIAFGIGIIVACLLPWVAVSFTVAAVAVIAGLLLYLN